MCVCVCVCVYVCVCVCVFRGGGCAPCTFLKTSWFRKKNRDSIHLCFKLSIQNVVLRGSRRKISKPFRLQSLILLIFLTKCLSKCPNSTKPPLLWKITGCAPVLRIKPLIAFWYSTLMKILNASIFSFMILKIKRVVSHFAFTRQSYLKEGLRFEENSRKQEKHIFLACYS